MARMGSTDTVVLGQRRRIRLEAMVARPTTAQRMVMRAKFVLAAWRGRSNAAIARTLGITVDTVRKWRRRFVADGMSGLHDRPRPGRPALYDLDAQLLIVATVTRWPRRSTRTGRTGCLPTTSRSRWVSRLPRSGGSWRRST
jgi:hypothetical protein